jgi:23S rRNA (adenine2503-C2)-methyltransferase
MDPRNSSPSDFLLLCAEQGLTERKARRILSAAIGKAVIDSSRWQESGLITKAEQSLFSDLPRLKRVHTLTSAVDGFQKVLFHTKDRLAVETVLIPLHKEGAVSVCLSSQVGCVMGCDFCATGRMKSRRNLALWEIVDQFVQARELLTDQGRSITGVVFMGMGEPFLNYKNVMAAAELFSFPVVNAVSAAAITVSTVGILDKIERFTDEDRPFRLSISIGAAIDSKRKIVVPVAAKTPVASLMAAAKRYASVRKERVMLSYVCIGGFNVGEEDARALSDLVGDTPVRLDLIEVTDTSGKYKRPTESEMSLFRDALSEHLRQPVVRRYSGGADIQAACGTLAGGAENVSPETDVITS